MKAKWLRLSGESGDEISKTILSVASERILRLEIDYNDLFIEIASMIDKEKFFPGKSDIFSLPLKKWWRNNAHKSHPFPCLLCSILFYGTIKRRIEKISLNN